MKAVKQTELHCENSPAARGDIRNAWCSSCPMVFQLGNKKPFSLLSSWLEFSVQNIASMRLGRDSSVGVSTRYELGGPEIESRWGRDLFAHIQTGTQAHPVSYEIGIGSLS